MKSIPYLICILYSQSCLDTPDSKLTYHDLSKEFSVLLVAEATTKLVGSVHIELKGFVNHKGKFIISAPPKQVMEWICLFWKVKPTNLREVIGIIIMFSLSMYLIPLKLERLWEILG